MPKHYKNKSPFIIAGSVALLAGCSALAPTWIMDTNDANGTRTTLIGHHSSNDTFYKFTYPFNSSDEAKEATLTTIDTNGETQSTTNISFFTTSFTAAYDVSQLSDSSVFLVDSELPELLYIDTEEGTSWNGNELDFPVAASRVLTHSHYITSQDQLLLSGRIERSTDDGLTRTPYISLISSSGEFLYFETFSDAENIHLLPIVDSENYLLVINYGDEVAEALGYQSYMQKRDEQMETIAGYPFDQSARIYQASESKLLGNIRDDQGFSNYGVFDYAGTKLSDRSRLEFEGHAFQSPLIGDGVYYDVRVTEFEEGAVLFDLPIYIEMQAVKICQYDFDFNENWCKQTKGVGYADIQNAQVLNRTLENSTIAVSYNTESVFISNVTMGLIPDELSFLGDLGVDGTVEYQANHVIYNADGSLSKQANEESYRYSGELGFGLFTFFTVEKERFDPGVIQLNDSHFFADQSIISSSIFTDGNESTPRLTFWQ